MKSAVRDALCLLLYLWVLIKLDLVRVDEQEQYPASSDSIFSGEERVSSVINWVAMTTGPVSSTVAFYYCSAQK
jgi:hypothetical protein